MIGLQFGVITSSRSQVCKKDDEICWTHKAWNGRVIIEWLSWCLEDCWRNNPELRTVRFGLTLKAQSLGMFICTVCSFSRVFIFKSASASSPTHGSDRSFEVSRRCMARFMGMLERGKRYLFLALV